mmetsp:Transcript_15472/g.49683  ORF Transcript_15472/g.49683 Transcript_15472/m.49683 type:complete len:317 (+) Transcript_15472:1097-2047(+)
MARNVHGRRLLVLSRRGGNPDGHGQAARLQPRAHHGWPLQRCLGPLRRLHRLLHLLDHDLHLPNRHPPPPLWRRGDRRRATPLCVAGHRRCLRAEALLWRRPHLHRRGPPRRLALGRAPQGAPDRVCNHPPHLRRHQLLRPRGWHVRRHAHRHVPLHRRLRLRARRPTDRCAFDCAALLCALARPRRRADPAHLFPLPRVHLFRLDTPHHGGRPLRRLRAAATRVHPRPTPLQAAPLGSACAAHPLRPLRLRRRHRPRCDRRPRVLPQPHAHPRAARHRGCVWRPPGRRSDRQTTHRPWDPHRLAFARLGAPLFRR